jgi:GNAT superfamily N-acetyltransferase
MRQFDAFSSLRYARGAVERDFLFVEERERRKGIGRRLLAEGEAQAKKLGTRPSSTGNLRLAGACVLLEARL